MSRDRGYLLDILESAKLIKSHLGDKSRTEFARDIQCQDAIIRRLEVIGEAARRVSQECRDEISQLSWSEMIGMRNVMIHGYDSIDAGVIWETIVYDLPLLISVLEKVLKEDD